MEASESSLTWSAGEGSDLLRPGADSVGQCPLPAAWDQVGCEQTGPRWSPPQPCPERTGESVAGSRALVGKRRQGNPVVWCPGPTQAEGPLR